jgi:hypothetical protein
MSVPPVPPPLEELGGRPFSFYPPILGIEHNEWTYRKATWSEIMVANRKSGLELYIPRVFVGELSRIDEPNAIVGLHKELEYKAGAVVPHIRRVIEMPRAVNEGPHGLSRDTRSSPTGLAPVVGIRLEHKSESKVGRLLLVATAVAVAVVVGAVALFQGSTRRVTFTPVMQSDVQFSSADDYYTVVNRLGQPADDKWRAATGELQYRKLAYPKLGINVILMGSDREHARYIGQLDFEGRVVSSTNSNTEVILRQLRKF